MTKYLQSLTVLLCRSKNSTGLVSVFIGLVPLQYILRTSSIMTSGRQELTQLGDSILLVASTLGFACIGAAILWITRLSPARRVEKVVNAPRLPWWRRLLWGQGDGDLIDEDEDVAEDQAHGVRTRVNPGGREATKATRREAKKRARTESRQSKEALAAKEWRRRQQDEKRRKAEEMLKAHEISRRAEALAEEHRMQEVARTVEFSRGVERYIANHKVSRFEEIASDLNVAETDVTERVVELEKNGLLMGVMVNDGGDQPPSFVRVSMDDMRAIASFIETEGRLDVARLTDKVNETLGLSGTMGDDKQDVTAGGNSSETKNHVNHRASASREPDTDGRGFHTEIHRQAAHEAKPQDTTARVNVREYTPP